MALRSLGLLCAARAEQPERARAIGST
uniref:Uncharacterized protein n=1 Tax=Arundo donax TaxID=35708 RepID=A0A0A9EP23_ARUDO